MHASFAKSGKNSVPLHAVAAKDLKGFLTRFPYLKASGFAAKEGELRLLPGKLQSHAPMMPGRPLAIVQS